MYGLCEVCIDIPLPPGWCKGRKHKTVRQYLTYLYMHQVAFKYELSCHNKQIADSKSIRDTELAYYQ